jgi:hypothetical protein
VDRLASLQASEIAARVASELDGFSPDGLADDRTLVVLRRL